MRDVFISYRRSDTAGHAGRLLDALEERFDGNQLFRDIEDLEPGVDFPAALNRALSQSRTMLVVIGPTWATVAGPTGPRIKEEHDFVRLEVAAALARKEVRVIPVLVGGGVLPKAHELPADLQELTKRNAFELSDTRWDFDVERLCQTLDSRARHALLSGKRALWVGAAAVAAVATMGAYWAIGMNGVAREAPRSTSLEPTIDPLVAEAEREVKIAELNAKKAQLEAEQAESEARKRRADFEAKQADEARAQAEAADTKKAVELALATSSNRRVSAAERAKASAEAETLKKKTEELERIAAAKASVTRGARLTVDAALADAEALKTREAEEVAAVARTQDVARVAAQGSATNAAAGGSLPTTLIFPKWTLSSGGCGAGRATVTGTARFSIERTSAGIQVTEEFRGSGDGFQVVVTGAATFAKEQRSYDIPTSGEWNGRKAFKSAGLDRVNTSDGKTPRTANVLKTQSVCS